MAGVRLAEPLAALSLVSDLARGRPAEEALRACLLATALGRSLGLSQTELSDVYYTALLRSVGCTATSHEYAAIFAGDDVTIRGRGDMSDPTMPKDVLALLWGAVPAGSSAQRARAFAGVASKAKKVTTEGARADCEVGAQMARRFELAPGVEQALLQIFERWDGKGSPGRLKGEAITVPARIAAVAYAAVMFDHEGGRAQALEGVGRWAGRILDPSIAAALGREGDAFFDASEPDDPWVAAVDCEPSVARMVSERQLDEIARGFADAVDLKSPFMHGHSSGVAALAERASAAAGLPAETVVDVRRAGLLHDLGRAGIPTGIWEKAGPLSTSEWEQVRLHAYHTERILSRAPVLAPIARLAGLHHERMDGSGYHRGAPPAMLDMPARILAAADVFQALVEERPHRAAFTPGEAARTLEGAPIDPDAARAVIEAAGQRSKRRATLPGGITPRELEVLRLLVRGRSEKEIAKRLFISGSTVHTHVTHIYGKAEVSTRAGLAMFAMEHDLVRPGEPADPTPQGVADID
jgi:HD-GYP domain-containing protein (c-di-GMP phosphodiesterase class II)